MNPRTNISYKCDLCSFTSETKNNLKDHKIKQHEKLSVFVCTHCENKFQSRDDLKEHAKEHDPNLPKGRDMGPDDNVLPCRPADPSHSSDCCDRQPGQRRPRMLSREDKLRNGYCTHWNEGYCRYEELCWKLHEDVPLCYHGEFCRRSNCQFYHGNRLQNSFLDRRTPNKYWYQERDFPPLPNQRRRN